jgi:hypothetical protein
MSTYEPEIFRSWNTYKQLREQLLLNHYPVYKKTPDDLKPKFFQARPVPHSKKKTLKPFILSRVNHVTYDYGEITWRSPRTQGNKQGRMV